jgi:hypothetical protein
MTGPPGCSNTRGCSFGRMARPWDSQRCAGRTHVAAGRCKRISRALKGLYCRSAATRSSNSSKLPTRRIARPPRPCSEWTAFPRCDVSSRVRSQLRWSRRRPYRRWSSSDLAACLTAVGQDSRHICDRLGASMPRFITTDELADLCRTTAAQLGTGGTSGPARRLSSSAGGCSTTGRLSRSGYVRHGMRHVPGAEIVFHGQNRPCSRQPLGAHSCLRIMTAAGVGSSQVPCFGQIAPSGHTG